MITIATSTTRCDTKRVLSASLMLGATMAALLSVGCNNSMDVGSFLGQQSQAQESQTQGISMQNNSSQSALSAIESNPASANTMQNNLSANSLHTGSLNASEPTALSVREVAAAARYIDPNESTYSIAEPIARQQPLPSEPLIQQFAGRYSGQVPCSTSGKECRNKTIDITLTLLPDGSAIRTRVQQGKVNSILDKDTANWTVSSDGHTIMVILPSNEIWSFQKVGPGKLQFEPSASALVSSTDDMARYALVASN